MAEFKNDQRPAGPLFHQPPPGYWRTKFKLERMVRFKNLIIHREWWADDIDMAPPIAQLFPGENLASNSSVTVQRINQEIKQMMWMKSKEKLEKSEARNWKLDKGTRERPHRSSQAATRQTQVRERKNSHLADWGERVGGLEIRREATNMSYRSKESHPDDPARYRRNNAYLACSNGIRSR